MVCKLTASPIILSERGERKDAFVSNAAVELISGWQGGLVSVGIRTRVDLGYISSHKGGPGPVTIRQGVTCD